MQFFVITLGDVFAPEPPSGQMMGMSIEPQDSLVVELTVQAQSGRARPWLAGATLSNGGRFVLALDSVAGRGEFRPVDAQHNFQVFSALVGLAAPR